MKYGNLRKVLQSFPLPPEVLHAAHDDDVLELVVVEVGSSERHDEVAQPNERRVRVGEQTDHHVAVQHSHRRLVPVLRDELRTSVRSTPDHRKWRHQFHELRICNLFSCMKTPKCSSVGIQTTLFIYVSIELGDFGHGSAYK